MGERVPFRLALDTARHATGKVLGNRVTPRQLRVFLVVVDLTAHWSKLEEYASLARIAELAGIEGKDARERDKRVAEDLRRLVEIGAVTYRPGTGRATSTVGLRPIETGSKRTPSDGVETGAETGSKPTPGRGRNRPPVQGSSSSIQSGSRRPPSGGSPDVGVRRDYDYERSTCSDCDGSGWINDIDPAVRCDHRRSA